MTPNKSTWLALVALPHAELPEPQAVAQGLGDARLGDDGTPATVSSQTANMATIAWGDRVVAYTLVPRPIPADQLAGPAACAWYWPSAEAELARHTAHLLVAMVDETPRLTSRAMHFTRLTQVLMQSVPAIGIQWGTSRAVHPAEAFCAVAEQATRDDLPLHLWVDFRWEATEVPGVVRLFTTGMTALGQPEIEVRQFMGEPQTLIGHAYNVAHYMLTSGKSLKDGEVLGLADDVRVSLVVGESMLGDGQEVVEMVFD